MTLYAQFILCLVVGLTGLCMALKTLFDTVFINWDVGAYLRGLLAGSPHLRRSFITDWEWERTMRQVPELNR